MKAIWKGTISFGLVSIPVQLFSAIQSHVLGFTLLCDTCHTRIEYQRFCPQCDKKVAWTDVVKGLEVSKGKYVVLTQEKIKSLKPKSTSTIDISEFIEASLIAPIYYDQHYYLVPVDAKKAKAYFLFTEALKVMKKAAIGTFVMHEKQHVCALQFYEKGILLSTLNYDYEIRSIEKVAKASDKKQLQIAAGELKLAKELISKLTSKKFNISQFKDTFAEQLLKLVKQSKKGRKIATPKKVKVERKKAVSLEDVLRESLHVARA